jgi:hypothetical protein
MMDLAREAVRRQPFDHCIRIEEGSVDPLGWRTKYTMKFDGVLGHGVPLSGFTRRWAACDSQPTARFYDGDEQGAARSTGLGSFFLALMGSDRISGISEPSPSLTKVCAP